MQMCTRDAWAQEALPSALAVPWIFLDLRKTKLKTLGLLAYACNPVLGRCRKED